MAKKNSKAAAETAEVKACWAVAMSRITVPGKEDIKPGTEFDPEELEPDHLQRLIDAEMVTIVGELPAAEEGESGSEGKTDDPEGKDGQNGEDSEGSPEQNGEGSEGKSEQNGDGEGKSEEEKPDAGETK